MDCPVCKEAMVVLELQGVEIDHCFGCGGIWLDAGELERLIDDAGHSQKLLNSFKVAKHSREQKRRCPICDKKMDKVIVGPASQESYAGTSKNRPELLIDECPKKHGLWFDAGELGDILERAQLDSDSRIQQLLAEIFSGEREDKSKGD